MKHLTTVAVAGALVVLTLLACGQVFAAGTPAGTVITNTATLTYKDLGGTSFPAVTATITITVAQKAGVVISPISAARTVGDSTWGVYPFTVQNTGNGKDKYDLTSVSAHSWTAEIYRDLNGNGVLDAADIAAGTVTSTDTLLADSLARFVTRVFVPKGTANGTSDNLTVGSVSRYDNAVSDSKVYTTTVQRALLAFTKNQDLANPQPGQTINYTLSYSNSGSGPALGAVLTDVLNTNVTLVGGSITGGGTYNSGTRTITWNVGRVGAGASGSFTFQATVNTQVPVGTVIPNLGHYTFTDSTSGGFKDTTSNTVNATVALLTGLSSAISPAAQTQDAGLRVLYGLTVTNLGNAADSVRLTYTSSAAFTWKFYVDINGNGLIDGADSLISVNKLGPLALGASLKLIAMDTIPHPTPDRTLDSAVYTFTSLTNAGTNSAVTGKTTVRAPILALVKSVAVVGGGQPVPGATLRYTLQYSNSGTGASQQSAVSDPVPANTSYVANSVVLNSATKTDASDADEVTVSSGTVNVNLGTVAAGFNGTITFDVKIQ
jgi:large repetitive protein